MTMNAAASRHRLLPLSAYFGGSFLLHLLWENLQAPLYAGYLSFTQHFWICFRAAWGDLVFMAIIYAMIAFMYQDIFWITDKKVLCRPVAWISVILIGIALAIGFEEWAILIAHRWSYSPSMPLLPLINVGLTPVAQMVVIPPVSLLFSTRFTSAR